MELSRAEVDMCSLAILWVVNLVHRIKPSQAKVVGRHQIKAGPPRAGKPLPFRPRMGCCSTATRFRITQWMMIVT